MRRIDFYTYDDGRFEDTMIHGYKETLSAISNEDFGDVKTTQMSLLTTELFSSYGFTDIYIHEEIDYAIEIHYDSKTSKITCDSCIKKLRLAHNLEKMWKAGGLD